MLHLEQLLDPVTIVKDITSASNREAACSHVYDRLIKVLSKSIKKMFKHNQTVDGDQEVVKPPQWHTVHELLPVPSKKLYSLLMSMHDKVSISGTYAIHHNIFLNFLKLDCKNDFDDELLIVVSDQLTIERMRSIQAESVESEKA